MSTQKAKFELFARLQELGFHYDEAASLRRIELTLQRWAERECGDGSNWAIERDEVTGKPFNVYHGEGKSRRYPVADREAGAIRRLNDIVMMRNARLGLSRGSPDYLVAYHQGDCRGCMVYLVKPSQVPSLTHEEWMARNPIEKTPEAFTRANERQIESYYNRGVAVCA